MAGAHARPVEDDVRLGVGTDAIDARAKQDLGVFATGEDEFHGATLLRNP
jgi:hypothetical protein